MRKGRRAALPPHALYLALGNHADERHAAYRVPFRNDLEPGLVDEIRQVTNGNFMLGDGRLAADVERMLGRRVVRGKPGRLFKTPPPPENAELFA